MIEDTRMPEGAGPAALRVARWVLPMMLMVLAGSWSAVGADRPAFDTYEHAVNGPWRIRPIPGTDGFVFTTYGVPGTVDGLRGLVAVMREKELGNGFDPGPAARASSRPLFEYLSTVGWPVICYPGYSDMQVKDGRARLGDQDERALRALDNAGIWSGIQLGEWGYYFHNLSHAESWWRDVYGDEFERYRAQMKPSGLAGFDSRPTTRRECHDIVRDYFLTRNRYMGGRNISVTGHSHYEAYVGGWGARLIGLELGENIGFTQSKIAFARGASRRWDLPWSIQVSPWFAGSCTTRGPLRMEGRYARGLDAGHSLSFYERMWLHAWFAGAALVTPENSIAIFFEAASEPWALTSHGEKARDVFRFTRDHDRGIPFTPIAIVLDRYTGYNAYRARPWGILENTASDLEIRDLFQRQLFPGSDSIHTAPDPENPEASYLRPTPFGEVFDVLLSDAPGEVLAAYPVVLLAGDIVFTHDFIGGLHRALRGGSRLLLGGRHVSALGEELDRLRGAGEVDVLEPWTNPETGRPTAVSSAKLRQLVRELLPFTVEGGPVQWQVNRNRTGWVIELIHNDGVIKKPAEPARIDSDVRLRVTVRPRFQARKARAWRNGRELDASGSVTLELPPGGVEHIEWQIAE